MNYIKHFQFQQRNLSIEENLYDDVDFEEHDIIEAQYKITPGYEGNPDICALPKLSTIQEIIHQNNYIPQKLYDKNIAEKTLEEKIEYLSAISQIRYPLPFHSTIEHSIYSCLVSSYDCRRQGIATKKIDIELPDEKIEINVVSSKPNISGNVNSFCIIGMPGVGKSTAIALALMKYPKVIHHKFDDYEYVQIPIINLTAYPNSNIKALNIQFAQILDTLLSTGNTYERKMSARKSIAEQNELLINWIRIFHIGLIIIDEIQFLNFSSNASNSFEHFVTITAETGVSLGVIGNQEASSKINRNLRISRRLSKNIINANSICENKEYFNIIIRRTWQYNVLKDMPPLTKSIEDALYKESLGSLDLFMMLFMKLQYTVLTSKKKTEINASLISNISKKDFSEIKSLVKSNLNDIEEHYNTLHDQLILDMINTVNNNEPKEAEMAVISQIYLANDYDYNFELKQVCDGILTCFDYPEKRIIKAYDKAELTVKDFIKSSTKEKIQIVLNILNNTRKTSNPTSKQNKSAERKEQIEHLYSELSNNIELNGGIV